MQQRSLRDSLYLVDQNDNESTFKYDQQLPPLPIPSVQESVFKLLDTIKPIAVEGDERLAFKDTERKALDFIKDENVNQLQDMLKGRAREFKNWLESWWLEFAYLRSRKPLIPYSNMAAPLPIMQYWPIVNKETHSVEEYQDVRVKRASLSTFFQLCFWRILREERMRPMIHKGVPWSMNQFKYLFNTVRRPGEPKDELVSWFKVEREGAPESIEIIVLHRGYIFAMKAVEVCEKSDKVTILSAPQIERQLKFIEQWCSMRDPGPGVGALTTMERTDWAEAREKLLKISYKNSDILNRIEKALSVLILDDEEPIQSNEIFRLSMCGDAANRWADKSISSIAFKNGTFGANADHTPYDGFCTGIMTHYLMISVEECNGQWNDQMADQNNNIEKNSQDNLQRFVEPELLSFELDVEMRNLIVEARSNFQNVCSTIETCHETFKHFGKAIMKEHRFHPEAFIQCAIHAAYFRQHNKMAPAYVTASTRKFHNGRTETCRSCYPEMYDFCKFLYENNTQKPMEAYELLRKSVDRFQNLMAEASNGQGCDRHLLGLYLTAILEGKKIPELFDDELVLRTNNYILSTSCAGYWNVCGGVPPLVEEGYGCFYGIEDQAITFCCTAYRTCPKTDLSKFYQNLYHTLIDMQKILYSRSRM